MTTQTIPLSQLVPSPANVRKVKTGIDGLAASIAAIGLLQNLTVRPADGQSFEVLGGGRRLAALKLLVKQKKIAPDFRFPAKCGTARTRPKSALPKTIRKFGRQTAHCSVEGAIGLGSFHRLLTARAGGQFLERLELVGGVHRLAFSISSRIP